MIGSMAGWLRGAAAQYLSDRCTIEREDHSEDEYGGQTIAWVTAALDVPCRLIKRGQSTTDAQIAAGRDTINDGYKLALLAGSPGASIIGADMRVTINGIVYQVMSVESALTDGVFVMLIIERKR